MATAHIDIPKGKIAEFCKKWKVREFALFGSVLTDAFGPDSDVDVTIDFEPDTRHTLFDMVSMQEELETIFGRKVDLMTRKSIEQSRNYIRREAILSSLETVYVA
jgi:hypothetical protein